MQHPPYIAAVEKEMDRFAFWPVFCIIYVSRKLDFRFHSAFRLLEYKLLLIVSIVFPHAAPYAPLWAVRTMREI